MRLRLLSVPVAAAALLILAGCATGTSGAGSAAAPAPAQSSASAQANGACDYPAAAGAAKDVEAPPTEPTETGQVKAVIHTSVGDIGVTLAANTAPCTVNSFLSLAKQGYFDDTSCHRLTTSGIRVLQCGDPTGKGTGGPGYTIPDELSGSETYPVGTLAMAKTTAPNSGGSQFFLVWGDTPLPPEYTVFGMMDEAGIAAVQKVGEAGTADGGADGAPKTPVTITGVTIG
ncbi:peptidylprolyl isomerase [Microbacterium gorillae]|uniref:peptidylprolyl isomerase n=1 Tax=Microbacterium gorillae TaxID=1231063 RepID=UPI00058D1B72|nr:peptidylprolyl isomerase [Microbacterium gorillae]